MGQAQFARAREVFLEAIELEGEDRDAFVESTCGQDVELRRNMRRK